MNVDMMTETELKATIEKATEELKRRARNLERLQNLYRDSAMGGLERTLEILRERAAHTPGGLTPLEALEVEAVEAEITRQRRFFV